MRYRAYVNNLYTVLYRYRTRADRDSGERQDPVLACLRGNRCASTGPGPQNRRTSIRSRVTSPCLPTPRDSLASEVANDQCTGTIVAIPTFKRDYRTRKYVVRPGVIRMDWQILNMYSDWQMRTWCMPSFNNDVVKSVDCVQNGQIVFCYRQFIQHHSKLHRLLSFFSIPQTFDVGHPCPKPLLI